MCVHEVIRPEKVSEILVLEKLGSSGPLSVKSSFRALRGNICGVPGAYIPTPAPSSKHIGTHPR